MAHNGIDRDTLIREIRNLWDEPDQNNTFLVPEGVYSDSNERLTEIINLTLDDIAQSVPIAERDFLLVGDNRPSPQEWELPEDLYDIQTVEDQAGYFRYPILTFEERKFARFGFAWVVSGYGSFGPYIRGNKIGFDPRLSDGDFRRIYYWGHPGRYGSGFGPSYATADQGSGTSIEVFRGSKEVIIQGFTGNAGTVSDYIKPRQILSVRTEREVPMPNGTTSTEIDYDHYVIDEVLAVNDPDPNTIRVLLGTDYKKLDDDTGLSFSIGDKITCPNIGRNALIYGALAKMAEVERSGDRVQLYLGKYEHEKKRLDGSWSRWQNQVVDRVREVS
jgi:hypothetical protein